LRPERVTTPTTSVSAAQPVPEATAGHHEPPTAEAAEYLRDPLVNDGFCAQDGSSQTASDNVAELDAERRQPDGTEEDGESDRSDGSELPQDDDATRRVTLTKSVKCINSSGKRDASTSDKTPVNATTFLLDKMKFDA
jgi:hypothetical protein